LTNAFRMRTDNWQQPWWMMSLLHRDSSWCDFWI
jgi:hypothetical protein